MSEKQTEVENEITEEEEATADELDGEELRSTVQLEAEERTAYFVKMVKEAGQVWTLGAEEELIVLAGEDEKPFIVVFPHPDYAQEWIEGTDLDEVDLVAIETSDWLAEILPGLQTEGISSMVFPTSVEDGQILDGDSLAKILA